MKDKLLEFSMEEIISIFAAVGARIDFLEDEPDLQVGNELETLKTAYDKMFKATRLYYKT